MLEVLSLLTAMAAIVSAFCWYRSAIGPNTGKGIGAKISLRLDRFLEKTPSQTWNKWAAMATAIAALLQGTKELISVAPL